MAKYEVVVQASELVYSSVKVVVEAANADQAGEVAIVLARDGELNFETYDGDDWNCSIGRVRLLAPKINPNEEL